MPLAAVRYADSDGLDIAYTVYGDGPMDVVLVPGLAAHLEFNEEIPFYRSLIEVFAGRARFVMYDKRGFGLSDRRRLGTVGDNIDDLVAVTAAAGIERCAVLGTGDGGSYAMAFAASHPERVSSLVLHASTPRLIDDASTGWTHGLTAEQHAQTVARTRADWGTGFLMSRVFAGHPSDPASLRTLARWERNIASPRLAASYLALHATLDLRDLLGAISCPTLLLHSTGDRLMSVTWSRAMAQMIPEASLIELPYDCHVGWTGPAEEMARRTADFILGVGSDASVERALLTVLFADVVGSTEHAHRAGDGRWRHVLDRFEGRLAETVAAFGGRLIKTTGDGAVATFDAPGRAVAAALAMRAAAAPLDLRLRTGIHTGEVELRGADIGGLAVHLAARIQASADIDEILVSRTVVDLTVGSRTYESIGPRDLKGFDRPWELFVVR